MEARIRTLLLLGSLALSGPVVSLGAGEPPATPMQPGPPPLQLAPCKVPGLPFDARCGTLEVWENRRTRSGRKIPLKIVVLPATTKERAEDAFVFLHGGPGSAATTAAPMMAMQYAEINRTRDVLLVDQRGTGGSHSLDLDLYGSSPDLGKYMGEFVPPRAACEGARKLAAEADLTQYTTPIAADDLDEVRAALGYPRLDLIGASYGTRAAMAYLRQYPTRVRTAVLEGVTRFDDHLPLHSPRNSQRALDGVLAECEATAACRAAFPELRKDLEAVFAALRKGPVAAQVLHPATGEPTKLSLGYDVAAEAVRYLLYYPGLTVQLPAIVHQAANGDWGPLAEMALFGRMSIVDSGSNGMFLAVMCSEDVPFIDAAEGERLAEGTFIGPARLRQLKAACACFPRGWLPEGYGLPVKAETPVLIISGALDPATPPDNGELVARTLPNSRHVVVPQAGHDYEGMANAECVTGLITAFVTAGSASGLDTSCVAKVQRRPFQTAPIQTRLVSLPEGDLQRLAGRYVDEAGGFEVVIERTGDRLTLALPDGERMLAAPVSATRLKVVGPPGVYLAFTLAGDKAVRVALEQGGAAILTLVPKAPPLPPQS